MLPVLVPPNQAILFRDLTPDPGSYNRVSVVGVTAQTFSLQFSAETPLVLGQPPRLSPSFELGQEPGTRLTLLTHLGWYSQESSIRAKRPPHTPNQTKPGRAAQQATHARSLAHALPPARPTALGPAALPSSLTPSLVFPIHTYHTAGAMPPAGSERDHHNHTSQPGQHHHHLPRDLRHSHSASFDNHGRAMIPM